MQEVEKVYNFSFVATSLWRGSGMKKSKVPTYVYHDFVVWQFCFCTIMAIIRIKIENIKTEKSDVHQNTLVWHKGFCTRTMILCGHGNCKIQGMS